MHIPYHRQRTRDRVMKQTQREEKTFKNSKFTSDETTDVIMIRERRTFDNKPTLNYFPKN